VAEGWDIRLEVYAHLDEGDRSRSRVVARLVLTGVPQDDEFVREHLVQTHIPRQIYIDV